MELTRKLYTPAELVELLKEQHAEITRQDLLLVVKDQEIARLKTELVATRTPMDPYAVACEIASKEAPSNDDMRRLRAAEVAIAYCGRPKLTGTVVEHRESNIYTLLTQRQREQLIDGRCKELNGRDDPAA